MKSHENCRVGRERTVLHLDFPGELAESGWTAGGGQWAGQGLCRLGSKVNIARTPHKAWPIKVIFMGPLDSMRYKSKTH